jgi:hypothetical protein
MKHQNKRDIEISLVSAFEEIRFSKPILEWLTSGEYRRFLDAWLALVRLYRVEEVIDINVEVVGIYRKHTEHLRYIIADESNTLDVVEEAEEALEEIEGWMDELIKEGERDLYNMDEEI